MTVHHHPQDDVLFGYAAGTLSPAPHLVVSAHLERCPACRARARQFEAVGGALLADGEPVPMAHDALNRALEAIRKPAPAEQARAMGSKVTPGLFPKGIAIPKALLEQSVGPWKWVAPGIQISKIGDLWSAEARGFLLKAAPGVRVPQHDHDGLEMAQMLSGALIDDGTRYEAGDCAIAMPGDRHQPQSDPQEGCICLIAIEGRTRPTHWTGRLIQRFIDI